MLALIAGTGDLPAALMARLPEPPLVCSLKGLEPSVSAEISFRLEHLGSFLNVLADRGVTAICMAGAVRRPPIDPAQIDAATAPLVPRIQKALTSGDDSALRTIITIFEARGFAIRAAHEIAPDLLPPQGVLTRTQPDTHQSRNARVAEQEVRQMGANDSGQACIVRDGEVVARETADGTDVMLTRFAQSGPDESDLFNAVAEGVSDVLGEAADWLSGPSARVAKDRGILFKGPKPNQDRRADLPVIGPGTARNVIEAGLGGIVIEAGGVMVHDLESVSADLDAAGCFLWVRHRGGA